MNEVSTFEFDYAYFIVAFPAFSNALKFPEALLQTYWDEATCYISDKNCGYLKNNCRFTAINLMTAHIAAISVLIDNGDDLTVIEGASIEKVDIKLSPPPYGDNNFIWWLNTTPYGQRLAALLSAKAVGGFYVGGSADKLSFRNAWGGWG